MFIVLFEVHPAAGNKDRYLQAAQDLRPDLHAIDGFIDNERFESRSRAGWVLSLSTWRDEKAVIRWRTQARHHLTQEKGRFDVFADYHLRVGEVTGDTHPSVPLQEQRFDVTEVGRAKHCTVVELVFEEGRDLPAGDSSLVGAVGLLPGPPGLDGAEVFTSLTTPGKLLLLAGWTDAGAASAFRPGTVAGTGRARCRTVRVIRDYGMADRRESPQYYPTVGQGTRNGRKRPAALA